MAWTMHALLTHLDQQEELQTRRLWLGAALSIAGAPQYKTLNKYLEKAGLAVYVCDLIMYSDAVGRTETIVKAAQAAGLLPTDKAATPNSGPCLFRYPSGPDCGHLAEGNCAWHREDGRGRTYHFLDTAKRGRCLP